MTNRNTDPLAWAEAVLKHIHEMKTRWGRQYKVEQDRKYTPDDVADAAGILLIEFNGRSTITPEELTKVKRQLTAAKAREGKQKKKIDKLTMDNVQLLTDWKDGQDYGNELEEQIETVQAQSDENFRQLHEAQELILRLEQDAEENG